MLGSFESSSLVWALLSAYLVVAGVVVFETDFRAPQKSAAGQALVCLVALVFAACWPLRLLHRLLQRSR
ncbi:MAG: hypothetical protein IRZ04_06980 [Rhodospirillales bacterium]|nr:hypothetical protein [Rhodospirillales bacterium]